MANFTTIDRLRRLNYPQKSQRSSVLWSTLCEHPDPVAVMEHLQIMFGEGEDSIEPNETDPVGIGLDDNEWIFYVRRVSHLVEQVQSLLAVQNPTPHRAAEIVYGALRSLNTSTEVAVAFAMMLNRPMIFPYAQLPDLSNFSIPSDQDLTTIRESLQAEVNLLRRLFHDANVPQRLALAVSRKVISDCANPVGQIILLSQLIRIGAHLDCQERNIRRVLGKAFPHLMKGELPVALDPDSIGKMIEELKRGLGLDEDP